MDLHSILDELGIKLSAVVAGLAGGLVSVLAEKRRSWKRALVILVIGALTAGYITPIVAIHTHFNTEKFDPDNSLGFLIGLISMRVIDLIITSFIYVKKNPKEILLIIVNIFKKVK